MEYCAKSELHPASAGLGMLSGRKMLGWTFRSSSLFIFAKPIYRPFGAGAFLNRYLGLKPQAESYCPFGAETECSGERR